MIMIFRLCPVFFLALAFIYLTFFTSSVEAAQNATEIRSLITAAASQVSKRRKVLIDPRIVDQMIASANIYSGNFCAPYGEDCSSTLQDPVVLEGHVDAFIVDALDLSKSSVRSLGDRLARGRLPEAGWPSNVSVDYGRVDIPSEMRAFVYTVRFGGEVVTLVSGGQGILALPGVFEVMAQRGRDSRTIRVIVESRRTVALKVAGAALVADVPAVLRPHSGSFCSAPPPEYRGPFALFNSGRATISESVDSRRENEAPHVHQPGISIEVRNDSEITCDRLCKKAIGALFAEAVGIWRSGCMRCDQNALAVLSVYDTTWVDWRISRRLREIARGSEMPLDLAKPQPSEPEVTVASPSGGTSSGIHHYTDVSDDPGFREAVCGLPIGAAPWAPAARSRLCGAHLATPEVLRPVVVFQNTETKCGRSVVACALPFEIVEINFREYRFSVDTGGSAGEFVIGAHHSGEVLDLRRIILHEVGHWFGVPHAEIAKTEQFPDIMASQYGAGEDCISPHSLRMLQNASDMRWEYRVRSGGALLPPRSRTR